MITLTKSLSVFTREELIVDSINKGRFSSEFDFYPLWVINEDNNDKKGFNSMEEIYVEGSHQDWFDNFAGMVHNKNKTRFN